MKSPEERRAEREARGKALEPPPLFTQACPEGKCAGCRGTAFRRPLVSRWSGALMYNFLEARKLTECVTCGMRFTRG